MFGLPDFSSLGGFGSTKYDAGYPAGYFRGFTLSVDAVADTSLGGGWQSMSLGSMTMNTNDLPAGDTGGPPSARSSASPMVKCP